MTAASKISPASTLTRLSSVASPPALTNSIRSSSSSSFSSAVRTLASPLFGFAPARASASPCSSKT